MCKDDYKSIKLGNQLTSATCVGNELLDIVLRESGADRLRNSLGSDRLRKTA